MQGKYNKTISSDTMNKNVAMKSCVANKNLKKILT